MAGPNAEFVIDIAARLDGGEKTTAELDQISAELMGAGKGADFFQQAVKKVSSDLDAARVAAESANGALAKGREEYSLLERAAVQASKAFERVSARGDVMSRAYIEAAQKAAAADAAVSDYSKTLNELEQASKGATEKEAQLAQTLGNVKKIATHVDRSITGQAESFEKLGSALGSVGGPLGDLGQNVVRPLQGFSKLSASIGSAKAAAVLGVVGFAALTAAVVALSAAVVIGAVKVAAWAVALADSARSAEIAADAFEEMNPELASIDFGKMAKATGQSSNELRGLAKSLREAGVETNRIESSLRAAALAETALGKGAAAEYVALEKAATDAQKAVDEAAKKSGGVVSKELTEKLGDARDAASAFERTASTKLGGLVTRQLQGLGAQSKALESNIAEIFGGLNIDPALEGMSKLVELFDKNSVAGKAIKFLFESVFQPLIDQADEAATVIEAFFLGFLIGATKLYIAIKPAIKAIAEFFGFEDSSLLDLLGLAKSGGEILAYVIAGLAAVFAVVLGAALVAAASLFAPLIAAVYLGIKVFGLLKDAVVAAYDYLTNTSLTQIATDLVNGFVSVFVNLPATILGYFMSAGAAVLSYLTGIDLASIGTNIMLGLARGIGAGAGAIVNAVSGAIKNAIASAKSLLGIASPSKVFESIGDFTGEGFVGGVEEQTGNAHDAMAELVSPPAENDNGVAFGETAALRSAKSAGDSDSVSALQRQGSSADSPEAAGPDAAAGSSRGGGPLVVFEAGSQLVIKAPDAPAGLEQFAEMLTSALEGDASQLGAAKEAS